MRRTERIEALRRQAIMLHHLQGPHKGDNVTRTDRLRTLPEDTQKAHRVAVSLLDGSRPLDIHSALCVLRTAYPLTFTAIEQYWVVDDHKVNETA